MAYPKIRKIDYSYTGFQQAQGDNSFPGTQLDNDLNKIAVSVDSVDEFLQTAFRSDGKLTNGSVDLDALSPDAKLELSSGAATSAAIAVEAAGTAVGAASTTAEIAEKFGDVDAAIEIAESSAGIASGAANTAQTSAGFAMTARTAAESARDAAASAAGTVGNYDTLAQANAALASIPANGGVNILADGANNGFYVKEGSALVRKSTATLTAEVYARTQLINANAGAASADLWADTLVDDNGNIVEATSLDGTKHITALDVGAGAYRLSAAPDDGPYVDVLLDAAGSIVEGRLDDGTQQFAALRLGQSYDMFEADIPGTREVVIDSAGNIAWALYDDGSVRSTEGGGGIDPTPIVIDPVEVVGGYRAEVNLAISYGQSWAHGTSAAVITNAQRFDSIMFNSGVRPRIDGASTDPNVIYAGTLPLIEAMAPSGNQGETPVSGIIEAVIERVAAEEGLNPDDHEWQWMGVAPAQGGTPISNLSRGTNTYNYLLECVTNAYRLARDAGKTFAVPVINWFQGQGDYGLGPVDRGYYRNALIRLRANLDEDIKAIVPGNPTVLLVTHQSGSHLRHAIATPNVDLAMLDAAKEDPFILMGGPMYPYPPSDAVHFNAPGYKAMGAIGGLAYQRTAISRTIWKPLAPIDRVSQGDVCVMRFYVPVGRLVLDSTTVANPGDFGFAAYGEDGSRLAITLVSVIGPDRVKIVAGSPISRVTYGWFGGNDVGNLTGPRGCLRDTQGADIVLDPSGSNLPLHNWCVVFEI